MKFPSFFGTTTPSLDFGEPTELELNGCQVMAKLVRSRRARKIRLQISGGNLVVSVPYRVSKAAATRAILEYSAWIVKHVLNQKSDAGHNNDGKILYRGAWHLVESVESDRSGVLIFEDKFQVFGNEPIVQLTHWLKSQGKIALEDLTEKWSNEMQLFPTKVQLRDQKTKWGSCSSRRTITFNWRLIMAPQEVMEYVVIHELAHLKEMNHSSRFWNIVAQYCPSHKSQRAWLKAHGSKMVLPELPD